MPAKPRAFLLTWPGAYHSRAVSYTHLDVYKRQLPELISSQFTAAVVGKISYCGRKGGISGVPALNWTRQGLSLIHI